MNAFRFLKNNGLPGLILLCLSFRGEARVIPAEHNRFQYHQYRWQALHTPAFDLYYPEGYDSLAAFSSVQLPDIMEESKAVMGTYLRNRPNIIIYPSLDQLYESNIGLHEDKIRTFPTIELKGNRMLVAFTGSYEHFLLQLKTAWIRMIWEESFKSSLEEQATNKRLQLPQWFREGCIRYFASGWPAEQEADLLRTSEQQMIADWAPLLQARPELSGQAFCYFLEQHYREDACKQVLFQMRSGKSLERALRLITKRRLTDLNRECFSFYRNRLTSRNRIVRHSDSLKDSINRNFPGEYIIRMLRGPDKDKIAWVAEKNRVRSVYISDGNAAGKGRTRVTRYRLPPWLNDQDKDVYPLLEWNEQGTALLVTMPVKGRIQVKRFGVKGAARDFRNLYGVDGVSDFELWGENHWLLAAFRKGKSDIVLYDAQKLDFSPFTDDPEDNTGLSLLQNGRETRVAYRSGFPADSLFHQDSLSKPYGVYLKAIPADPGLALQEKERLVASDSDYISWHRPVLLPGDRITMVTTGYGLPQTDTYALSKPVSNSRFLLQSNRDPWLREHIRKQQVKDSLMALEQIRKARDLSVLGKILMPGNTGAVRGKQKDSLRRALAWSAKKVRPYILQLYSAYFSAGVSNDYYINRYQPFRSYLGAFKFPEVGAMLQGGFSDLFDNHHFNIGYRMPAGTEGSDFFSRYENTARNTDWHILFFRKVESLQPDPGPDWKDALGRPYPQAAKVKTQYYELGLHRPLTYDLSLDLTTAARGDRTIFLATDKYSLDYADMKQWWSISTLSVSISKMKDTPLPFLQKGWSAKWMTDGMLAIEKPSVILYGSQLKFNYEQPLLKGIHFSLQLQAGYSGGQSHILYNFGGTDNNIVPRIDSTVRFAQDAPYAFQTLVTPFRGYPQNSLYGSSYAVYNADLYFPLFSSLIPLQTGVSALNHLQLGMFTDGASAAGPAARSPGDRNTLYSWGFSARTLLAGYPVRFDLAWPGSFEQQPVWYLSLSL